MLGGVSVLFGLIIMLFLNVSWLYVYFFMFIFFFCLVSGMFYEFWDWHMFLLDFGGDLMSVGFSMLSVWVLMMMIIAVLTVNFSLFLVFVYLLMMLILLMVFMSVDFFMFYIYFEAVLFPIFVLILGWGYQPERIGAGNYLIFYTVFCSLPLLVLILVFSESFGIMSFVYIGCMGMFDGGSVLVLGGVLAFLVSMPMYGMHLWLPKAHVEASVDGSMILAGVLLKIGGYGLIRFGGFSGMYGGVVSKCLFVISIFGMIVLGIVCLRQVDLKSFIAYSSIIHMGLVVCGSVMGMYVGIEGSYVLMVGHGLCSSGLFYYCGLNYFKLGSRGMIFNSGVYSIFSGGLIFWFFFVSSNMAFPPSLNLVGEVFLLGGLVEYSFWLIPLVFCVFFFSGLYGLFMMGWVYHGHMNGMICKSSGFLMIEGLVSLFHWLPLNIFFLLWDIVGM